MSDPHPSLEVALSSTYRLERELGRGGMAVVYLAHDLKHDRKVALKVIRPDLSFVGAAERFSREIKLAARLQHPHILSVHDSGQTDPERGGSPGVLWYTMPFVDGESLRDRLEREGKLPIADALRIAREAAQALAYAHKHSVIHRDIKPENLLLSRDGSVLVADFGIARALVGKSATVGPATGGLKLTETGVPIGTPAYMAPEVRLGVPADERSDVYGLASVLFEMLTGKMAAPGGGFSLDLFAQQSAPLARAFRPEIPLELDQLVRRGMHPVAEQRFETMDEFAKALAEGGLVPIERKPKRRGPLVGTIVIVGMLLLAALFALTRDRAPAGAAAITSVAVLPFQNVGGDTAEAYFAQGMADELTTALVQGSDIRVASQNGIARIQPNQMTAREVGRQLDVGAVLEGSVRRAGNRLRVTAQLTGTGDGVVLWAQRYDRELSDVFQVQDEITQSIVAALKGALSANGHPRAASLDAYDLYLRGRYFLARRGRDGIHKAIEYLGQSAAADSTFAQAPAALSMAYAVLPVFSDENPDSLMRQAATNAAHALALDSSLAEAHLALAYVLKNQWRFADSEREFRAALQLAPNDPLVHHWYGVLLYATGRVNESVDQLTQARQLDPFGSAIATDGAVALYAARRFAEARSEVARSLGLDSAKSDTPLVLGWVNMAEGKGDSAIVALERARTLGTGFDIRPYLSVAYRQLGRSAEADRLYREVREAYGRGNGDAYSFAIAATGAGDRQAALSALSRIVAQKSLLVTELSMPCDPLLDPLVSDSRFIRMLAEAGMMRCQAR